MNVNFPEIIVGILVTVIGIIAFILRARWARASGAIQRKSFGDLGEAISKTTTPFRLGFVAIGAACMGIVIVLLGIFYHRT